MSFENEIASLQRIKIELVVIGRSLTSHLSALTTSTPEAITDIYVIYNSRVEIYRDPPELQVLVLYVR